MLGNEIEILDLTLSDVLQIMNESFYQIQKELNELRTLALESLFLLKETSKN